MKRALCFGTFDPLHYGHIRLFRTTARKGLKVYACTEADEIIKEEKGREPFTSELERVEDLHAIKYIQDVGIRCEQFDRAYWCKRFKADVLVVGDDWQHREWEGEKLGLPIIYLPYTRGITSTLLRDTQALI